MMTSKQRIRVSIWIVASALGLWPLSTPGQDSESFREINLQSQIEEWPVVATGTRWPMLEGIRGGLDRFLHNFPQVKSDPKRWPLGDAKYPAPLSRGGGLFPVLQLLDNGELACVFRTGAPHRGSGSELSISFSKDQGRTWSDYQVIVRGDTRLSLDRRNPSFGQAVNGDLVLVYGILADYDGWGKSVGRNGLLWMETVRSTDRGRTWSEPKRQNLHLPVGVALHPFGQMRRLGDGPLVFNARGYDVRALTKGASPNRQTYLYWSRDHGRTWDEPTLISAERSEAAFLPLNERDWVAYVRNVRGGPSAIGHSHDGGKTWPEWSKTLGGDAQTQAARLPASLVRLPNGYVLATYGYRQYPFGVRAIVSRDDGKSFDLTREYIIADTHHTLDCGYPSTVAFSDGTVVTVAYTLADIEHPEWGTAAIAYRYDQSLFAESVGWITAPSGPSSLGLLGSAVSQ